MTDQVLLMTDEWIEEKCAEAAHEVNRVYCSALGDDSQPFWVNAPPWQRVSALKGVKGALAGSTPAQLHQAWVADKLEDGWMYGPEKDPATKKHPCLVEYFLLSTAQRMKDVVFAHTVKVMALALGHSGNHGKPVSGEERLR